MFKIKFFEVFSLQRFPDEQEKRFQMEVNTHGLNSLKVMLLFGTLAFSIAALADLMTISANLPILEVKAIVRTCFFLFCGVCFLSIRLFREYWLRNYISLGVFACVVAGLIITSFAIAAREDDSEAVALSTLSLALYEVFVYGFVRLRFSTAILVCVPMSLLFLVIIHSGDSVSNYTLIRAANYLLFTNILGIVLCYTIERRDRDLVLLNLKLAQTKAELETVAAQAQSSAQEKSRLLASVSHDLRQPISALTLNLEALEMGVSSMSIDEIRLALGRQSRNVEALNNNITSLLEIARLQLDTAALQVSEVSVDSLLNLAIETFQLQAKTANVQLRIRKRSIDSVAITNESALWQVILNLVVNAVKFNASSSGRKGSVLLSVTQFSNQVRVDIVDNGVGIAPSELKLIWEPYYQIGNRERNRDNGLGLGLAHVRAIIDKLPAHRISVASKPSAGTRFRIWMPLAKSPMPLAIPDNIHQPAKAAPDYTGYYFLVIEDDREVRSAMVNLLSTWGALCEAVSDSDEALAAQQRSERFFDLVIADFRLPGSLNGLQCIYALWEQANLKTPAVIVSGEGPGVMDSVANNLPIGFVAKPVSGRLLQEQLKLALLWRITPTNLS